MEGRPTRVDKGKGKAVDKNQDSAEEQVPSLTTDSGSHYNNRSVSSVSEHQRQGTAGGGYAADDGLIDGARQPTGTLAEGRLRGAISLDRLRNRYRTMGEPSEEGGAPLRPQAPSDDSERPGSDEDSPGPSRPRGRPPGHAIPSGPLHSSDGKCSPIPEEMRFPFMDPREVPRLPTAGQRRQVRGAWCSKCDRARIVTVVRGADGAVDYTPCPCRPDNVISLDQVMNQYGEVVGFGTAYVTNFTGVPGIICWLRHYFVYVGIQRFRHSVDLKSDMLAMQKMYPLVPDGENAEITTGDPDPDSLLKIYMNPSRRGRQPPSKRPGTQPADDPAGQPSRQPAENLAPAEAQGPRDRDPTPSSGSVQHRGRLLQGFSNLANRQRLSRERSKCGKEIDAEEPENQGMDGPGDAATTTMKSPAGETTGGAEDTTQGKHVPHAQQGSKSQTKAQPAKGTTAKEETADVETGGNSSAKRHKTLVQKVKAHFDGQAVEEPVYGRANMLIDEDNY